MGASHCGSMNLGFRLQGRLVRYSGLGFRGFDTHTRTRQARLHSIHRISTRLGKVFIAEDSLDEISCGIWMSISHDSQKKELDLPTNGLAPPSSQKSVERQDTRPSGCVWAFGPDHFAQGLGV